MKTEEKRGGARVGAGRKKQTGDGLTSRHQVSLDNATVEAMRALGDGSLSEGIRRCKAFALAQITKPN